MTIVRLVGVIMIIVLHEMTIVHFSRLARAQFATIGKKRHGSRTVVVVVVVIVRHGWGITTPACCSLQRIFGVGYVLLLLSSLLLVALLLGVEERRQ